MNNLNIVVSNIVRNY